MNDNSTSSTAVNSQSVSEIQQDDERGPKTFPIWRYWKKFTNIKIWEVVALSKNIDPQKLDIIEASNPLRYKHYLDRIEMTISWLPIDLPMQNHPDNGIRAEDKVVAIKDFVRCAQSKGMRLTPRLIQITSVINDPFAKHINGDESENSVCDLSEAQQNNESPFDPMTLKGIARIFELDKVPEKNMILWAGYARQAHRNGLKDFRLTAGRGRGKSTFDPMDVGEWLIKKEHMAKKKVNSCLADNLPPRSEHLKDHFVQ